MRPGLHARKRWHHKPNTLKLRRRDRVATYVITPLIVGLVVFGFSPSLFDETQATDLALDAVQPGAKISRGTLAFIFEHPEDTNEHGQPKLYASTHAHGTMTGRIGEEVLLAESGASIGTIVAQEKDGYNDWSLIEIDESMRAHTDPTVRGWTGPTGPPEPGAHRPRDIVCMIGYGTDQESDIVNRNRCGEIERTFTHNNVTGFSYTATTWRGDSGSPIIHYETGQALGIHLGRKPEGHAQAIDLCSLLDRFHANGYPLELTTAAYRPPHANPLVTADDARPFDTACLGGDPSEPTAPLYAPSMQGEGFEPSYPFGTGS